MSIEVDQYLSIVAELKGKATLVAVSKTKPIEDIRVLYELGQRDFGENYVQELTEKYEALPKDIRWHFIGHLQSNKVKYIAPFVHLIHGVDSENLLKEINKQAVKNDRVINCLLQVHIAKEESKFGLDENELTVIITHLIEKGSSLLSHTKILGLMGMASFSTDMSAVKHEFEYLKKNFDRSNVQLVNTEHQLSIISMGMSADYKIAIEAGSNMVRIGSLLFGRRNYPVQ